MLQADGQPFFPLGWYTSWGSPSVAASEQYLGTMRAQGMNTALICYGVWLNNSSMTNQLEGAVACNMKIMVEVHRWAVMQQPGYPLSLIDDQVDLLKGYATLLNWYLIDEPEIQVLSPADTQARYAQVKARDPDHTISVAHYAYQAMNPPRPAETYLAAEPPPYCDVLMTDTYPVTATAPEFTNALWEVALHSKMHAQLAVDHAKQVYINIVQTHGENSIWGLRIPSPAENRYLSYAPVVLGARGLLYWMHNAYTTDAHRNQVVPVVAHELQSLVPAIISNSPVVSVISNRDSDTTGHGIADVSYLFGQDSRRGYLMAVNNTANTLAVAFQLSGAILASVLGAQSVAVPVMFEGRNVQIDPTGDPTVRTLNDSFPPYDVNVYLLYETAPDPPTGPPSKAASPNPAHQASSVGQTFDLTWAPGQQAAAYDVYFGTTNPPTLQGRQNATILDPGTMAYDTTYYWRVDSVNDQGTATGDLWTFRTVDRNVPGKVGNPNPADVAGAVSITADLSWTWGASARSYDVYFGTANPPPYRGNQTGYSFDPGTMTYCTTYFWRVDPVNDDGTTTGDVWSFTTEEPATPPPRPSGPSPAHQACCVALDANLTWVGVNAASYNVYFGTTSSPVFRLNQTGTSYDPGPLALHTRYYWRVDAINPCVTVTGDLWTFTIRSLPGDLDNDDDVDQEDFGRFQACLSGSGMSYRPGCEDADLERDGDIDQDDFGIFQGCMSGANMPADPNCAN